ncbi:hypothetical protein [Halobacillus litoralis]|uniref:Uncharacterized protein n=1 Tax=Halobacillus litoralis TaxID=45668 RepID=A0A410MJC4_9BACI|nr:hypothetical protein [Halobacillus litoralis]QAS54778.1 hypothetical protein HLI_21205 [Halobacillus litoralis]
MFRSFIVIFLCIVIAGVSFIIWNTNSTGEKLDLEKSSGDLEKDIESLEALEKNLNSVSSDEEGHEHNSEGFGPMEKYQDRDGTIKFFFGSIMMENTDIFIQSFKTEVISNALFAKSNPDKDKVALDLINKISRKGNLKDISIKKGKAPLRVSSDEYSITLWYKDGKRAEIPLSFSSYSSTHHPDSGSVYVIETSPLEIIKNIEGSLK